MNLKEKIHAHYLLLINDQIDAFRDRIKALTEDSRNDAKGSAGDKHETALSMMHIEQEKLNNKISELLLQKAIIDRIDPLQNSSRIVLGSLVKLNEMTLYISTALPKIIIDGITITAVSPQSPLGTILMGKESGFSFEMNQVKYRIEAVE